MLTPAQVSERLQRRFEKRMEALQRVKLDDYAVEPRRAALLGRLTLKFRQILLKRRYALFKFLDVGSSVVELFAQFQFFLCGYHTPSMSRFCADSRGKIPSQNG